MSYVSIVGYFKRFNVKNQIVLVNLDGVSRKKLENIAKSLGMGEDARTPILPNGTIIKHNLFTCCHNIDDMPCNTKDLFGQLVKVRCKIKKYRFFSNDEMIQGFSLYASLMESFK
jgi:hypothetical protein